MRIRSVWISSYKNLQDFSLELDNSRFLDVFVGKNGSGKSNLLEALIEIFKLIFTSRTYETSFDFSITYDIRTGDETQTIKIDRVDNQFAINDKKYKSLPASLPLPDNVFIYYSGQNKHVNWFLGQYDDVFKKKIKGISLDESRKFIGIGPEYKDILLAVCLFEHPANKARRYVWDKLGIQEVPDVVSITLHRPDFAKGREIEAFDARTHFWGMEGVTREFVEKLTQCIKGEYSHSTIYDKEIDKYQFNISVELFQKVFVDYSPVKLFRDFDNLKVLGMKPSIGQILGFEGERYNSSDYFSDGQYQSVYLYALAEILKDTGGNYITLLDEPDAFLHPEWQLSFLDQITDIAGSGTDNNHIIMTSHSAATLCNLQQSDINMFDVEGHRAVCNKQPKKTIINNLSNSVIQYSEAESKLLIDNVVKSSDKPVLFVEGISDVAILNTAYEKLYPGEDIPVLIQDAYGYGNVKVILSNHNMYDKYPDKQFFGLFDFDKGYEEWWGLDWAETQDDVTLGLCKRHQHADKDGYALMLPIPEGHQFQSQVLNPPGSRDLIQRKPCFYIEHFFHDYVDAKYFQTDNKTGNIVFKSSNQKKTKFADEVVPTLPEEAFAPFRSLFDQIARLYKPHK